MCVAGTREVVMKRLSLSIPYGCLQTAEAWKPLQTWTPFRPAARP
jgi:hypothetical protein